jgi:hypothetical protein
MHLIKEKTMSTQETATETTTPKKAKNKNAAKATKPAKAKKGEDSQAEEHPIRQQGREGSGIDEAQGRRHTRGDRQSHRLAESQYSRFCQRARH